jgi:hypothetical protein
MIVEQKHRDRFLRLLAGRRTAGRICHRNS